jgi:hypothetical protein
LLQPQQQHQGSSSCSRCVCLCDVPQQERQQCVLLLNPWSCVCESQVANSAGSSMDSSSLKCRLQQRQLAGVGYPAGTTAWLFSCTFDSRN